MFHSCVIFLQLLGFMYSWLTFYHQGHEVATDCKPYMTDLQKRIQNVSVVRFSGMRTLRHM